MEMAKSIGSGARLPDLHPQLYHLTAVCSWATYSIDLCFRFLTYKLRTIIAFPFRTVVKSKWVNACKVLGPYWLVLRPIVSAT